MLDKRIGRRVVNAVFQHFTASSQNLWRPTKRSQAVPADPTKSTCFPSRSDPLLEACLHATRFDLASLASLRLLDRAASFAVDCRCRSGMPRPCYWDGDVTLCEYAAEKRNRFASSDFGGRASGAGCARRWGTLPKKLKFIRQRSIYCE